MNIKCNKCGKLHNLPSSSVDNRKIFFYCSSCGHKVIVDNRKDQSVTDKSVVLKNDSYEECGKSAPTLFWYDICSAVGSFFSYAGVMIALIYSLFASIVFLLVITLFAKNKEYFFDNSAVGIIIFAVVFIAVYYLYNLVLYIISKIFLYRISNKSSEKLNWNCITFDIREDSVVIAIVIIGLVIAVSLALIPISFLDTYSVLYSGLMLPIISPLFIMLITSILLKEFIPAVIASRSGFIKDGLKDLFGFFIREFKAIPLYMIIVKLLNAFFSGIILMLFVFPFIISVSVVSGLFNTYTKSKIIQYFIANISPDKVISTDGGFPVHIGFGVILFTLFVYFLILFLWALLLNLKQAIVVNAVYIMQKNPRNSMDNKTILTIIFLLFIVFILMLGVISGLSEFIMKFRNLIINGMM